MDLILARNLKRELNKQSKTLQSWFNPQENGILNLTWHSVIFYYKQTKANHVLKFLKKNILSSNSDHLKQTATNQHNLSQYEAVLYTEFGWTCRYSGSVSGSEEEQQCRWSEWMLFHCHTFKQ